MSLSALVPPLLQPRCAYGLGGENQCQSGYVLLATYPRRHSGASVAAAVTEPGRPQLPWDRCEALGRGCCLANGETLDAGHCQVIGRTVGWQWLTQLMGSLDDATPTVQG
ncbi:hypothetical protein XA68_14466 [Ophiocordyceps unilateralis]|uniref:Uncharacterized protein n=1 Tax=Ophiocordyceps unilateralis TaxID=268505 RepID=A0A2A9PAC8_OPHUN|nr:hypothetical protein XA68_14466 [Ophiocordyceps unilateralis]